MKKIIIFTAAYGNGHNSVAQVLKEQIKEMLGQNMIYVVNDVRNKLAVNFMFDNAVIK